MKTENKHESRYRTASVTSHQFCNF